MANTNTTVLLKLHHLTGTAWRIEMLSLRGVSLGNLVDVLDCKQELVADRAYALAAERGMTVMGHTVHIEL